MNRIQKSFRIVLVSFAILFVSACATTDPVVVNRYKDIPIAVYGEPIEPAKISKKLHEQYHDELPIDAITEESSNEEVILAWVQSYIIVANYADQLEEAIKPFQDIKTNDDN